ncbi:hypothetical protein [Streptomyces morookaense]|uniref:PH domain-containing protein n=1 Tax=Streptomyces morookaense TaxID=1970 RepID=A0A7Y7B9U2_STRMO|nr:hypothetical protein [Streptomyces morookaense]NVK81565.1 hypothetical protein [Streptomyces morookaense]GHF55335.1 membrane protein [Streptomyces morookaense]
MPLPFVDAPAPAAPSPVSLYEDPDRWRRPYRPGPLRVGGTALVLLLAAYVLCSALIIACAGAFLLAGMWGGVAVVLLVLAVRLVRTGIWVGPAGLRQIRLLSTRTLAWAEVGAVRVVEQPVRWLGLPRRVPGRALVVEPFPVLVTDHGADFLERPLAFAEAASALQERVAGLGGR